MILTKGQETERVDFSLAGRLYPEALSACSGKLAEMGHDAAGHARVPGKAGLIYGAEGLIRRCAWEGDAGAR
jgi:hypothetical protein